MAAYSARGCWKSLLYAYQSNENHELSSSISTIITRLILNVQCLSRAAIIRDNTIPKCLASWAERSSLCNRIPPSFSFTDRTLCKMGCLHLGPLDYYQTTRSTVEEQASALRRGNEEEARITREWQQLSEAERRVEGLAHELYCTLCGIPFWFSWDPHGYTSEGDENCLAWVNYFLARE